MENQKQFQKSQDQAFQYRVVKENFKNCKDFKRNTDQYTEISIFNDSMKFKESFMRKMKKTRKCKKSMNYRIWNLYGSLKPVRLL